MKTILFKYKKNNTKGQVLSDGDRVDKDKSFRTRVLEYYIMIYKNNLNQDLLLNL